MDGGAPMWEVQEMRQHPSYHGNMTGTEAELRLEQHSRNGYLTRYSKYKKLFKLSVIRKVKEDDFIITHFTLIITRKGSSLVCSYKLEGTRKTFTNVSELLEYYKNTPLTHEIDGIGDCIQPNVALSAKHHSSDNIIIVNNTAEQNS